VVGVVTPEGEILEGAAEAGGWLAPDRTYQTAKTTAKTTTRMQADTRTARRPLILHYSMANIMRLLSFVAADIRCAHERDCSSYLKIR
jgi:hypothetical protein